MNNIKEEKEEGRRTPFFSSLNPFKKKLSIRYNQSKSVPKA